MCSTVRKLAIARRRRLRRASDVQSGPWPRRTRGSATPVCKGMYTVRVMSGVVPSGMESVRERHASFH
eukprot:3166268-Alexandrium_andersonii.AAC.1